MTKNVTFVQCSVCDHSFDPVPAIEEKSPLVPQVSYEVTCPKCQSSKSFTCWVLRSFEWKALDDSPWVLPKTEVAPNPAIGVPQKLTFTTQVGQFTCASRPGNFCRFFGVRGLGQKPWCRWFHSPLFDGEGSLRGWVLRSRQCLKEFGTGE